MRLEGYSDYEIDVEKGTVWSYKRNRYVGTPIRNNYCYARLTNDKGEQVNWYIHRLVWTVVNGEIPKDFEINHIDENPLNNAISNLSLMTHKENINWGNKIQKTAKAKSKPIIALVNDKPIMYFSSVNEIKRKYGYSTSNISYACLGKNRHKTAYGYQWKYQDDYLADWWEQEMEKAL